VKEEIRVFSEKAEKFEEAARYFAEKGVFDLSAFHIEQAMQLYIKFILAKELGYFPRVHSLTKLFQELGRLDESFKEFYEEKEIVLKDIEDAYILSRYFPRTYSQREVEEMMETLEEFKRRFGKWLSID
jgi:HEPN domain-containing protein